MRIDENAWHLRLIRFSLGFTPPNVCVYFWAFWIALVLSPSVATIKILAWGHRGLSWVTRSLETGRWDRKARRYKVDTNNPETWRGYRYVPRTDMVLQHVYAQSLLAGFFVFAISGLTISMIVFWDSWETWASSLTVPIGVMFLIYVVLFPLLAYVGGRNRRLEGVPREDTHGRSAEVLLSIVAPVCWIWRQFSGAVIFIWTYAWAVKHSTCPIIEIIPAVEESAIDRFET